MRQMHSSMQPLATVFCAALCCCTSRSGPDAPAEAGFEPQSSAVPLKEEARKKALPSEFRTKEFLTTMRGYRSAAQSCFFANDGGQDCGLKVSMVVAADGRVTHAAVIQSELPVGPDREKTEECVVSRVRQWRFPVLARETQIAYWFECAAGDVGG